MQAKPALQNVLVLSVGHTLPGLYCLAALRDLGAQVVRIERLLPQNNYEGMDVSFPIRSLTAGTHELRLNLKHEEGVAVFQKLAATADVVLEGFRPGVMQRLGIGYDSLNKINSCLVYAAITGYGQEGEYADKPGHDINYLAETGILHLTNPVGLPGATYGDGMSGVCAALNIVAALHARGHSGEGQMIDCAIVDGPLSLMSSEFEYYWNTGEARAAGATHLTGGHPWYGIYSTRDGRQVAVGAVEPLFYQTLCHRLGLPELATQQYASGAALHTARAAITAAFAARTLDEILALFRDHEACVSPICSTDQVLASPLAARAVLETGSERLVRSPVRLPPPPGHPSSLIDLLLARAFTKNEIEKWVAAGIMALPQVFE